MDFEDRWKLESGVMNKVFDQCTNPTVIPCECSTILECLFELGILEIIDVYGF